MNTLGLVLSLCLCTIWCVQGRGTATKPQPNHEFVGSSERFPCRYAGFYTSQELLFNETSRNQFIENMMVFEGNFHKHGVGYNSKTGLTYDGHPINYTTGELALVPHPFSASSKESLHVGMLALALSGNSHAQIFINNNENNNDTTGNWTQTAVDVLTSKISSYEQFNTNFPGFGGFFPWFMNLDTGMIPTDDFKNSVPGLDNGQLAWSIFALTYVIKDMPGFEMLYVRYRNQLQLMIQNCVLVFYQGNGYIRAVTTIANVTAPPSVNQYSDQCTSNCYLDDPYEGELMAFFMDLFGEWENPIDRELIWVNKRKKLQPVDYWVQQMHANITVQRGFWFSAHEQWKYMVLPYLEVPIAKAVFRN